MAIENTVEKQPHADGSNNVPCGKDSELIIGLVGAIGTNLESVKKILSDRLETFRYKTHEIRVSTQIINKLKPPTTDATDTYQRYNELMTAGNYLREVTKDKGVLALAVAAKINEMRKESTQDTPPQMKRTAIIVSSLKHPEEVQKLRQIYSNGFFLIGTYADEDRRLTYLTRNKGIESPKARKLMERDTGESDSYGQHTRDTFHLSDFFISDDGESDKIQNDIWRILDLIFGKPFVTPTFDEFAMFMAFSASLRSADLSRQVGAVMTKDDNIVSTGANDVPKAGGGLYWPEFDKDSKEIRDKDGGRDYKLGRDRNATEKNTIIDSILNNLPQDLDITTEDQIKLLRSHLEKSKIKDITEYGRIVHAEMEAILACGRNNISTKDAVLYCTTFPCHNCAKHIIAAGIKSVVYVEPYPKSKAFDFHSDSMSFDKDKPNNVVFKPFVGVGPRSFFNLFSMQLGSGYQIKRKNPDGTIFKWEESSSDLRMQMLPSSYIEREILSVSQLGKHLKVIHPAG